MSANPDQSYVNDNSQKKDGAASPEGLDLQPLIGKWVNTNAETGGIVELVVSGAGEGLDVQVFGACSPQLCDWGVRRATTYGFNISEKTVAGFETLFDFGFQEALVTAIHNNGVLVIHTYHKFKDDSGRANYIFKEFYHQ